MNNEVTITGRFVHRMNARFNSDFCINKIYLKDNDNLPLDVINKNKKGNGWEVTVQGYNLPTSKAKYYGDWIQTKFGTQFKV